jgi:predicted RNase H-like nuclease (RuvC/YqgF family)
MNGETGEQLRQCLELLAKIREEYPEGDFDRELIHGEMDFRYRQIKEDRDKLEAFPKEIREFTRLLESLASPHEEVKKFCQPVSEQPHMFLALANIKFNERQEKLEELATELQITARNLSELLTRTRLAGVLNVSYELNTQYIQVINAYLKL